MTDTGQFRKVDIATLRLQSRYNPSRLTHRDNWVILSMKNPNWKAADMTSDHRVGVTRRDPLMYFGIKCACGLDCDSPAHRRKSGEFPWVASCQKPGPAAPQRVAGEVQALPIPVVFLHCPV